jgi:hypothetical protein
MKVTVIKTAAVTQTVRHIGIHRTWRLQVNERAKQMCDYKQRSYPRKISD